jgi:uncharacterized protein YndB with AHSA1/START domain
MEPAYSVERTYPVSMDRLWHAWTNGAALETWYHGVDHRCVPGSVTGDAAVGAIWSVGIHVPQYNVTVYFYGTYATVTPQTQIVHSMHYTESAEAFAVKDMTTPAHRVVVDFAHKPDGAWVRFAQYGDLPAEQIPLAKAGMGSYFDSLGQFLAAQ